MHISTVLTSAFAVLAAATPVPSPLEAFKRAGPAAGQVITKCSSPGMLALAFDDGPYQYTQTLVDTLNAAGAKGTFFVTGTLYGCIYNQKTALQNAYSAGHQIASHSWSHPSNFGSLSAADLTTQMQKLEGALVSIIGKKPTYMRPPYLATGGSVQSTMATLGYRIITDDVDSGDWNGYSVAQSEQQFTNAGASGNGHIPLMHETYQSTVTQLVPWLISWASQNNLKLVTVAECLGDADGAYTSGTPASSQTC
ncbi:carbohydrate esterase family 4 protein [Diplodia corticola]|uniref:Carbohydrate esterase family 4 protein n=1 Tax=Diplodia corticola TaxID=236234 RepID=A0A1J9R8C6_9PEZI|nr:carbohydrate esterase family 4 protein [Diplodia corticola]OJD37806.1 carbohydrate esterase family 4 protein [Diplodia corticola]